jgi:hypothetical protein
MKSSDLIDLILVLAAIITVCQVARKRGWA